MLNIEENSTTTNQFALFALAFRPFFLGAGLFAVISVLVWMAVYIFNWQHDFGAVSSQVWHAHEMIYGYAMAVVAGFLLTAIKNWTGIQTLHGWGLAVLFLLWVVARVLFMAGNVPILIIATADIAFMVLLVIFSVIPILKVKQWINFAIVTKLLLMMASNVVFYLGVMGIVEEGVRIGLYSGLYLIVALIFTMGRRVIPFFIERGVDETVELTNRRWVDLSSLALFLLFWIFELVEPNGLVVAILGIALFVLHGLRLAGWYTPGIWRKPLLWSLYLAYGFLITGLLLKSAAYFWGVSPFLSAHAFAYGGVGLMTIGMMSRVALGHTARDVFSPPPVLFWLFAFIFVGAVIRVFFPILDNSHYALWIGLSQVLWVIAFGMFVFIYTPVCMKPRLDGRPG